MSKFKKWYLSPFLLAVIGGCGGGGASSSPSSLTGLSEAREFATHVDIEVGIASRGSVLRGRLLLPLGDDAVPLLAMVRGSERWSRLGYDPLTATFVDHHIAVVTWDKREGGSFEAFAVDAVAALRTAAAHPRVDRNRLGRYGFSEGGWIVPLAASSAQDVSFTIIGSGPAVSTGEDDAYDVLTGVENCTPSGLSEDEIDAEMASVRPSGFDPEPYLRALRVPALWQFCANDRNIPVRQSIAELERIRDELGSDLTIQVFPRCNHNFVRDGDLCVEDGPRVDWPTPMFRWLTRVLGR